MGKKVDLSGSTIGRWTLLSKIQFKKRTKYLCQCSCGKIKEVLYSNLKRGKSLSCGCMRTEVTVKRNTKHGLADTRLKGIYEKMKQRCLSKNHKQYQDYGGRGIRVCKEWLDKENGFMNFYTWAMANGYRKDLSIDRIDNNGDYEPNNCRWTNALIQANNTRHNVLVTYKNETLTLAEMARKYNVSYKSFQRRVRIYKWSVADAIEKPYTIGGNRHICQADMQHRGKHFQEDYTNG